MKKKLSCAGAWCARLLLCLAAAPSAALAQGADIEARLAKIEGAATGAQSAGDTAWVLVCAALVLLMTGPGLALFYGGLVRRKNVLSTMTQSFILMAVVTVLWALFGYSVAFSEATPYFGGLDHAFLRGVGSAPNETYAATIPHQAFMVYQLMFAVITPALITGAFAERIKFSAMLAFTALWTALVYLPLAHMVWGKGGLLNAALGGAIPALDFAGGTVVHVSSGFSALACAVYLGRRAGFAETEMRPHSLVLSLTGACMLWVGWFGFNAGSALAANGLAANAFVTTHLAAAAATLAWTAAEWVRAGKPSALGAISGAVAGLVGVTPASGFVTPMSALVIGLAAGLVCFLMVTTVKRLFAYDDSLDVFGVHGAGGTVGALLTGVFAASAVNPVFKDAAGGALPVGLLEGNSAQLANQAAAVAITAAVALAGSFVILKAVDLTIGLRVSDAEESIGLDLSQHGEEAYAHGAEVPLTPAAAAAADILPGLTPEVTLEGIGAD